MTLSRRFMAECFGTFWLVFAGCGSAVLTAAVPQVGIGLLGVSLAFGLSLLTMAYAITHISGCHLNPAVTVGLAVGRRLRGRDVPVYIAAQLIGAIIAGWVLYVIASGQPGFSLAGGLASNGYGLHSPGGYSLGACAITEAVLTFMFVMIIMGATDRRAPQGFAPIAIGLALALANMVAIHVTNASINPARSTGPAVIARGWAIQQLWLFWVAPVFGAAVAGFLYPALVREAVLEPPVPSRRAA